MSENQVVETAVEPIKEPTEYEKFLQKDIVDQTGQVTLGDGSVAHFLEGKLHGTMTKPNGDMVNFKNGILHSDPGVPTIMYANGEEYFYENDVLLKVVLADGTVLVGDQIP